MKKLVFSLVVLLGLSAQAQKAGVRQFAITKYVALSNGGQNAPTNAFIVGQSEDILRASCQPAAFSKNAWLGATTSDGTVLWSAKMKLESCERILQAMKEATPVKPVQISADLVKGSITAVQL